MTHLTDINSDDRHRLILAAILRLEHSENYTVIKTFKSLDLLVGRVKTVSFLPFDVSGEIFVTITSFTDVGQININFKIKDIESICLLDYLNF